MNEKDHLLKIKNVANELIKAHKKQERITDKQCYPDLTNSQVYSLRNAKDTNGEYIEMMMHELHCLCVEIGVAKMEDWRYGERIVNANNWKGNYKKFNREPNKF